MVHCDERRILHANLSDLDHTFGFELLTPSAHPSPAKREQENQMKLEAFVAILLRRRDSDSLASTPLLGEWVTNLVWLFLAGKERVPLALLRFGFTPGCEAFQRLVSNCRLGEVRAKFRALEKLSPRALRAEVGSASRLINEAFGPPAFRVWSRGGFDLGGFLDRKGILIVERGGDVGDPTMQALYGAIVLKTVEYVRRRRRPHPPVMIWIDEVLNCSLYGRVEQRILSEESKNQLFLTLLDQGVRDFPGGNEAVTGAAHRREYFRLPSHDVARRAAIDLEAGMPPSDESRAERIAKLTAEITGLAPGWRYVRTADGVIKEYVPLLESPWPDWPGLREAKLKEVLSRVHRRPEYRPAEEDGEGDGPPSSTSSGDSPPPPPRSPAGSSAAERWRRGARRPADGS